MQENERRLTERIAAFRIEKETIKATYTASQAQVRVNEAVAGLGTQLNSAGASLDRARDKVSQMQARAAATDELPQQRCASGSHGAAPTRTSSGSSRPVRPGPTSSAS